MNRRHAVAQSMRNAGNAVKNKVINFGRVSSSDGKTVNVQTTYDNEARSLKNVLPYGIASCPIHGLFAQIMMNDRTNNTFLGVYDPESPELNPGEVAMYNSTGSYIKIDKDGTINADGDNISISSGQNELSISNDGIQLKSGQFSVSISSGGILLTSGSASIIIDGGTISIGGNIINIG